MIQQVWFFLSTNAIQFLTFLLAIATFLLWWETYKMRKGQLMPIIAIHTRPHEKQINYILMTIVNCGNGIAKKIQLSTNSDFPVTYDLDNNKTIPLNELGIFKFPFDLGSMQKFEFILKFLPENYEELRTKKRLSFDIDVKYEDIYQKKHVQKFTINLEIYHHLSFIKEK